MGPKRVCRQICSSIAAGDIDQLLCTAIDAPDDTLCQNGINDFKPMKHLLITMLLAITGRGANEFGTEIVEEGSIAGSRFLRRNRGDQATELTYRNHRCEFKSAAEVGAEQTSELLQ